MRTRRTRCRKPQLGTSHSRQSPCLLLALPSLRISGGHRVAAAMATRALSAPCRNQDSVSHTWTLMRPGSRRSTGASGRASNRLRRLHCRPAAVDASRHRRTAAGGPATGTVAHPADEAPPPPGGRRPAPRGPPTGRNPRSAPAHTAGHRVASQEARRRRSRSLAPKLRAASARRAAFTAPGSHRPRSHGLPGPRSGCPPRRPPADFAAALGRTPGCRADPASAG